MPTSKKRLNITLPDDVAVFLQKISLRDDVPQSAKALELLEKALEIEEDEYFSRLAEERLEETTGYISHDEFWSKIL